MGYVSVAWWVMVTAAVCGPLCLAIGIQLMRLSMYELTIRQMLRQNGIQTEILKGLLRTWVLTVLRLSLLSVSAWFALPFIGQTDEHRWQYLVESVLVLSLIVLDAAHVFLKCRERMRLLYMAQEYRMRSEKVGGVS